MHFKENLFFSYYDPPRTFRVGIPRGLKIEDGLIKVKKPVDSKIHGNLTLYGPGGGEGFKVPGSNLFCDFYFFLVGNMPETFLLFLNFRCGPVKKTQSALSFLD